MNKIGQYILSLFFMGLPLLAIGAENVNAYVEGGVWEGDGEDITTFPPPLDKYFVKYYIEGSRTVNGIEYLDLYEDIMKEDGEYLVKREFQGSVRNENGRVYLLPPDWERDLLIFDFNLKTGEEIYVYYGEYPYDRIKNPKPTHMQCIGVEERLIDGMIEKIVKVYETQYPRNSPNSPYNEWISGIGTVDGPIANVTAFVGGNSTKIRKVYVNGNVIYQIDDPRSKKE